MKKLKVMLCCLACVLGLSVPAFADTDIKLFLNNEQRYIANSPQIIDNRVYVPLRDAFGAIGVTNIKWNAAEKEITAEKENTVVTMHIGQSEYTVKADSETTTHQMDAKPVIIDSFTYVPARYAAEAFGYGVEWDADNKIVRFIGDESFLGYDENTPKTMMIANNAWIKDGYCSFTVYFLNNVGEVVTPSGYLYTDMYNSENLNMYHSVYKFETYYYNDDDVLQFNIALSELPKCETGDGTIKIYIRTDAGVSFDGEMPVSGLPTKY